MRGKIGHLKKMRRQREKVYQARQAKVVIVVARMTRIAALVTRATCCRQTGHRLDCSQRNEKCNHCEKQGHLSHVCLSGSGAKVNARVVELESDDPCRECGPCLCAIRQLLKHTHLENIS